MCFLPRPRYSLPTARQNIAFGGLNQLPKIQIGELRASTNMDNSMLPALRVRGGRYIEQELELQPGDSQGTVYSWQNIFATNGIFVKTYIKLGTGTLPLVTIK